MLYLAIDQQPAHEATPKAKAILVQADRVADEVGLDDEVLREIVATRLSFPS